MINIPVVGELLGCVGVVGLIALSPAPVAAQNTGTVRGAVELLQTSQPVHGATVLVVGAERVALTDERGEFVIDDVPAGAYEVLAQREHLTAVRQAITVAPGQVVDLRFRLELSPVHEELTVTATAGGQSTTFEAFNVVTTLDSFDLVTNPVGSFAEALEDQPGIAKRSFGPGSSRPIIRGFDGDRVLMMEDGIRTGDLSSQSGDHGVTTDPNGLERLEVVHGPATLLYGANAVGGVVNAITPQESLRDVGLSGTQGQLSFDTGSANGQAGTTANVQHGRDRVMVWGGGGARRSGDYRTPEGTVENSGTRLSTGRGGIGYVGTRLFASGGVTFEDARYGVPFVGTLGGHEHEEEGGGNEPPAAIDLDSRRRVGRFDLGMRNLNTPFVDSFEVVLNVIDWEHDEVETEGDEESIGTSFDNRTYVVRADLDQRQIGRLSGRLGFWTQFRDYVATGEEALAPPTEQNAFAVFAYEELDVGRYRLQFGGRAERNAYRIDPSDPGLGAPEGFAPPNRRNRTFFGTSASVGLQTDLGTGSAVVVSLSRSHRAPALEELYNFGPHVGNLAFEVGNPALGDESILGFDLSLRHQSADMRGGVNVYLYSIDDFVFQDLQETTIDNLRLALFRQGDSRFSGFDARGSVRLGGQVWANLSLGLVDARLTTTDESLPRIPPFQGQLSLDIPYRGFSITPEWTFAAKQSDTFRGETATDGYSILNVRASYVRPMSHMVHILTVSGFNLTDELYRNHTSFIKDLAPEIGRGIKVGYSVRFF